MLGSRNNLDVFGDAVETVHRQAPVIGALVTHRFPLERAGEALELLAEHPEVTEKVVVEVGGRGSAGSYAPGGTGAGGGTIDGAI